MVYIRYKITEACNYDCSYCFDKRDRTTLRNPVLSGSHIENLIKNIQNFNDDILVGITGGEPFSHPQIYSIAEMFSKRQWGITITSNFSFPFHKYERFFRIVGSSLRGFVASLHLEYVASPQEFIRRFEDLLALAPFASYQINCVVDDYNIDRVLKIKEDLHNERIRFRIVPKIIKDKPVLSKNNLRKIFPKDKEPFHRDFRGRKCYAGYKSIVVDAAGDTFACHNEMAVKEFQEGKIGLRNNYVPSVMRARLRRFVYNALGFKYLGNIYLGKIKLYTKHIICRHHFCRCAIPQVLNLDNKDAK